MGVKFNMNILGTLIFRKKYSPNRFKPHRILIILARIFVLERFEINDEHREENNDDNWSPVHPAPFKKWQRPIPDHTFCILPEFFAP